MMSRGLIAKLHRLAAHSPEGVCDLPKHEKDLLKIERVAVLALLGVCFGSVLLLVLFDCWQFSKVGAMP